MKIWNLMHSKFGNILDVFAKLRIASIIFVVSVCPSVCSTVLLTIWNNSVPTGLTFITFDIWLLFEHLSKNNFLLALHGDQQHLSSYLVLFFLELETIQTKSVKKIKTFIFYSKSIFRKSYILWHNVGKKIVEPRKAQMTKWHMRFACWIPKITDTLTISLIAFPLKQSGANTPQYCVIRILPASLKIVSQKIFNFFQNSTKMIIWNT